MPAIGGMPAIGQGHKKISPGADRSPRIFQLSRGETGGTGRDLLAAIAGLPPISGMPPIAGPPIAGAEI